MENENSLKNLISNSLQDVRKLLDANTVTGNPICLANGVTIIPISKISLGFVSGGLDLPARGNEKIKDFGGGGGTGVTVTPVGFLSVSADGAVEMIPMTPDTPGPFEQINDLLTNAPQLTERFRELFNRKPKEEKAEEVRKNIEELEKQIDLDNQN